MKIKKLLAPLLAVAISIFMAACTEDTTKEDSETANKTKFSVIENNTVQDVCEYYLKGINVTKKIKPSIVTGLYSYYDVQSEDNTYIDIILDVKNLNSESKTADNLITTKIKINNNEYKCFSVVESADDSDLENYASINSLETRLIHYLVEVPLTEVTGEMEIILTINGKNFSNKFNLEDIKITSPSVENEIENKQMNDTESKNNHQDIQKDSIENEYYIIMKKAWQQQQDYIDSIDDPKIKQSLQTPESAAIMESNNLLIKYPEDSDAINSNLNKILNGE